VPVIEFPFCDAVPLRETLCAPSVSDMVTVEPLTVPLNVPDVAHGEPLMLMVPESWLPVWARVPERNVLYPKLEMVLACQYPARLRT